MSGEKVGFLEKSWGKYRLSQKRSGTFVLFSQEVFVSKSLYKPKKVLYHPESTYTPKSLYFYKPTHLSCVSTRFT